MNIIKLGIFEFIMGIVFQLKQVNFKFLEKNFPRKIFLA